MKRRPLSEAARHLGRMLRDSVHILMEGTPLAERFRITHTTIQMECATCANGPMIKELNHRQFQSICQH